MLQTFLKEENRCLVNGLYLFYFYGIWVEGKGRDGDLRNWRKNEKHIYEYKGTIVHSSD